MDGIATASVAKQIQADAIASLEQDKAILDWLEANHVNVSATHHADETNMADMVKRWMVNGTCEKTIRQACLKAMKGNE